MERVIMEIAIELAGLIICVVYRRLTASMWLMIGAMAAALMISGWRVFLIVTWESGGYHNKYLGMFVGDVGLATCWAVFLVGLARVLAAQEQARDDQKALALRAEAAAIEPDERIQPQPVSLPR